MKWDTLTLPKIQGGLGLRNANDMNTTCLMKLAWNLKPEEDKLWSKVLIGKYGRGTWASGDLLCKPTDSYIWKALTACWDIIKVEEAWALSDGNTVNFWLDNWLDKHRPLMDVVCNIPSDVFHTKVSEYVNEGLVWRLDSLRDLLPDEFINKLMAVPVPESNMGSDMKYWPGEKSAKFTVSSAYHHL